MCINCEGFTEEIKIKHPYEYYNLIEQIKEIIDEGTMILVKGTCNLNDIKKNKPWPDDYIEHVFKCKNCEMEFVLSVETYHGSGGSWRVLIE